MLEKLLSAEEDLDYFIPALITPNANSLSKRVLPAKSATSAGH